MWLPLCSSHSLELLVYSDLASPTRDLESYRGHSWLWPTVTLLFLPSQWDRLPAFLRYSSCFLGAISLAAPFMTFLHQLLLLTRTQGIPELLLCISPSLTSFCQCATPTSPLLIPKPCRQACLLSLRRNLYFCC